MKRLFILLFLFPVFLASLQAGENKGLVCADLMKVFQSYKGTQAADAYLKAKAKDLQESIDKLKGEISSLDKLLKSGILSREEKEKKSKEMEAKKKELENRIKSSNLVMMQERRKKVEEVLKEIEQKVAEYARKKGYRIILDKKDILFVEEGLDITDDLIKFINQEYEKKGKS